MAVRATLMVGGLVGGAGVMAAAGASHGEETRNLAAISAVCLAHGPTLLALGLSGLRHRILAVAAGLIGAGTVIFAGDLMVREWLGHGAFPLAAPLGGIAMIGGWAALMVAGATINPLKKLN
ncbi:hypothetical protein VW29_08690 [Devosia limi DSM 17137]|nr:hypothetical protein VW29_08690 [Devosia limi DSM 17137]